MPSTYTTNLGIEKIGTGEQSGTWGTTTNTNFDLIDQGVNGIVQVTLAAVGSTGSPNALTIDNGALSDGRNKFIEFVDGGDLGGTAYVQLQPNDSEKIAFIRNSLSGSRSIIIFQGTYNASNDFEIPNGADVVLKFDGAGASATVTQVFDNLTVSSATLASGVTVNAIFDEDNMASDSDTALATQQSIKAYVDSQVGTVDTLSEILANGNTTGGTDIAVSSGDDITFADSSKAIFGAGSDLQIYHDGSHSYIQDTDAGNLYLKSNGAEITLRDGSNTSMIRAFTGGGVRLYNNGTERLEATSTGIDVTGTLTADGLTVDGSGSISQGMTNGSVSAFTDPHLALKSTDSVDTTGFVGMSFATSDTTNYGFSLGSQRTTGGQGDLIVRNHFNSAQGTKKLSIASSGDISFYEDTGTTPKFFWDASAESLGIGRTPDANGVLQLNVGAGSNANITFAENTTNKWLIGSVTSSDAFRFYDLANSAERMRIDSSGNVGINTSSPASKLDVSTGGIASTDTLGNARSKFEVFTNGQTNNQITLGQGFAGPTDNVGYLYNRASAAFVFGTNNTERMRITGGGNFGIKTTSPSNFSGYTNFSIQGGTTGSNLDFFSSGGSRVASIVSKPSSEFILETHEATPLLFRTNNAERMRIDSSGNVGIGTSSPQAPLNVSHNSFTRSDTLRLTNQNTGGYGPWLNFYGDYSGGYSFAKIGAENESTGSTLRFHTADTSKASQERMRIDSSGNVGIANTAPSNYTGASSNTLVVGSDSGNNGITVVASTTGYSSFAFADSSGSGTIADYSGLLQYYHNTDTLNIFTAGTERMRIDSSGNLLVNVTSAQDFTATTTNGHTLYGGSVNAALHSRSGDAALAVQRTTNDGAIVNFFKDTTTVGSITSGGVAFSCGLIGSSNVGVGVYNSGIVPISGTSLADNLYDVGDLSARWDDVYATNGTIQTSDANEKQDIDVLSEAEQRVAVACKGLLRKFRWKSAVAEKGDDARIHFGIIAQDLQAAFEAEGLDAGDYAMFIHSTWTDEETGEERSRMGVRYSELLAFIIAAI